MDKKLGRFKVIVQIAVGEQVLEYNLISFLFYHQFLASKVSGKFSKALYMFKLLQEIQKSKVWSQGNQGFQVGSRCVWDSGVDGFATASFENNQILVIATAFGLYYEQISEN